METKKEKSDRNWARWNKFFGPASIGIGLWFMTNGSESPFFHLLSPFQVWIGVTMVVDYLKYKIEYGAQMDRFRRMESIERMENKSRI